MDTEGKTLAELVATEGLKPGDVVRCEYDGGHGRLVSGRQYDVVSRNGYLAIHVGGGWYIMFNDSARFTIVSRATPADPVKLDEGGKVAGDIVKNTPEWRFANLWQRRDIENNIRALRKDTP